jgi:hypothetical protein
MRPSLRFMVFNPPRFLARGAALALVNVAASDRTAELAHYTVVSRLAP